jgi:hypothetical protein
MSANPKQSYLETTVPSNSFLISEIFKIWGPALVTLLSFYLVEVITIASLAIWVILQSSQELV